MTQETQAIYAGGVLRPLGPLTLAENQVVDITVRTAEENSADLRAAIDQEDWLPFAEKQLQAIESLAADWDSYGAEPPNPQIVKAAGNLVRRIRQLAQVPKPHINPTPSGGVQFDWASGGKYFEIDLVAPATAEYFYEDSQMRRQAEGTVQVDQSLDEILNFLKQFVPAG